MSPSGGLLEQTSTDHENNKHKSFAHVTLRLTKIYLYFNIQKTHLPGPQEEDFYLNNLKSDVHRGIGSRQCVKGGTQSGGKMPKGLRRKMTVGFPNVSRIESTEKAAAGLQHAVVCPNVA